MLINFCEKHLKPTVSCSTVSNDGYDVTNLINDSDKGFLAYSCIKPPIYIDFTFICDIRVSRVLIWPSVGAQKSSGFELCVKSGEKSSEYKRVSTGFLSSTHSGILFYRRDIDENSFDVHPNFLQRYIRVSDSQVVNNVRNLRISILRTENSVPAIGRIQVWGRVSQSCSKETVAGVQSLWENKNVQQRREFEVKTVETRSENVAEKSGERTEEEFNVPESFLDPITWSIMIQPIVLPSGATIDQSTLEKHAKTEATWGRAPSDPFTGIPFSESRKPIVASALKARIDKFLLDNEHASDVKSLPRLSGYKQRLTSLRHRSMKLSEITPDINTLKKISNSESKKLHCDKLANRTLSQSATGASHHKIQEETRVHRLPIIPMCSKRAVAKRNLKIPKIKPAVSLAIKKEINSSFGKVQLAIGSNLESNLDRSVKTVLSSLQRFDEDDRPISRECLKDCACSTKIFYKLPCNHVVCKDVLMSRKNSQCAVCGISYCSRDPERVHTPLRLE